MADEHVAYFWDREDADAVAELLGGRVRRGRFHGEDDDEDHPWVVVTAADPAVLEQVAGEHDGWLEAPADEPTPAKPPPLPTEPRRLKNR
ncbi:hypothetical protein [Kribbella sp. VKM Ac-2568]|uniref:hypothetical protein n=1 Tax=Kribbella sp. VKM Ac-2568 TaxID=2512219 RepID=UPI001052CD67|nr:hypothetical protein [Kribbella sp. VKM Ac-2568]TCM41216.1 hypothetical protein EV648_112273 [Kribbella sp. VKM Ac-2568]